MLPVGREKLSGDQHLFGSSAGSLIKDIQVFLIPGRKGSFISSSGTFTSPCLTMK
jgi:hypothetical protein